MRLEFPSAPGEWRHQAACRGQTMFYAAIQAHNNRVSIKDREMERAALASCQSCEALQACRAWALQPIEPATDHVAGGLTPRQRNEIRKGRRA